MTDRLAVIDTSSLVISKKLIAVADQWAAFKLLEEEVVKGRLVVPRHVINECSEIAHPDLPGAWAPGMRKAQQHPIEAEMKHLQSVMSVAGDVVDATKTKEDADPWVVALACQLAEEHEVVVVTDDVVDRMPIRIAMATACDRLGVTHMDAHTYLTECGIKAKKPDEDA